LTKKIKHPSEFVNVGEKLDVVVLELDVDGRKLSLGHKQTTANPWDQYEDSFARNYPQVKFLKLLTKELL
jgi:small subunit ribosomal protein S1